MFDLSPIYTFEALFDPRRLEDDVLALLAKHGLNPHGTYTLTHRGQQPTPAGQLQDFPGSLDVRKNGVKNISADEYTVLHADLVGTYLDDVLQVVRTLSKFPIGRVRWANMAPKTCYSYHVDADPVRFHIPIRTHAKHAFFMIDDAVYRMPEEGRLYGAHVQLPHTFVNSMLHGWRAHLLFDTYDADDPLAHTRLFAPPQVS